MLEVKKITKVYKTGDFNQIALNSVSLKFRKNEFVSILGPSGSGKTTLLNIIGGLDRYDAGNLIINNKETKNFKDQDWDSYRNNCVGFIFQSYNLISHISVLQNVELGMTLSGISAKKRQDKALEVLEKVGLKEHANKKPNQLSGGQMQRVAIARALANDPEIILADEPTGALDSKTSVQIMELIKEIAKDKLVIMVTHNPELAHEYANRIIDMKDGTVTSDSNPVTDNNDNKSYNIKKTAMNYLTALKLSFNNIKTKKGRTLITAFASSIGIIGISLILALSNGFDIQISEFEKSTLSSMPIMITEQAMSSDDVMMPNIEVRELYPNDDTIYPMEAIEEQVTHTNNITLDYVDYIESIDSNLLDGISTTTIASLNLMSFNNGEYKPVGNIQGISSMPTNTDGEVANYITKNYDVVAGNYPEASNEILLIMDNTNSVEEELLTLLGLDINEDEIKIDNVLGKELKAVKNDDYYLSINNYFVPNQNLEQVYNNENNITLKVVGVIRGKEDTENLTNNSGILYMPGLLDELIESNQNSLIVNAQLNSDVNVLTGAKFEETGNNSKDVFLSYLGNDETPIMIQLYPKDFETKEKITEYLDKYNDDKEEVDQILYTDMAEMIANLSSSIMDAITIVLVAFSAISLVVSSIMIGIITYISVLERTKEIGVLRSLGARKKDITRVFNAETLIIGFSAGTLGLLITWLLTFPINIVIESLTDLPDVAKMNPIHAISLLLISMILTLIGGFIPSKMASKKDPVEALRTE